MIFTETTSRIVDAIGAEGSAEPPGSDSHLDGRSARRIAATIGRLVSTGALEVGTRLPTVRELSRGLGVSPTTVSEAWRRLADVGAIETRGRNGTFVCQPTGPGGPRRYRQITAGPGHFDLDLSTGTPDPELLPDLAPIVAKVSRQSLTSSYLDHPVLPALEEQLRATWPFQPEALTVVDGALDALDRIAATVLRLGDRVIVEHPTFPPLLDLLERLSCDVIGVDVDEEGLDLAQLASAVTTSAPVAMLLQPRAQNPAGVAMSSRRAAAIADVLGPSKTLVIEDDHANAISSAPLTSLGTWLPDRTIHVRSFSKSHGPDLRLAAVGGAGDIVTAVENRRLLGPGWSSRILQSMLLELISDPATDATMAAARAAYTERRRVVSELLSTHDIDVSGSDGINLWVTVDDERATVVALAARGVGVAPGTPFLVRPDHDHVRITTGALADASRIVDIAAEIAAAAAMAAGRGRNTRTPHR